jgi:hypothetical protein
MGRASTIAEALSPGEFGQQLLQQVEAGASPKSIGAWAYLQFLDHDLAGQLRATVLRVATMEEGPEFEMTREQLIELAEHLLQDAAGDSQV